MYTNEFDLVTMVQAAQQGDREAFGELVVRFTDSVTAAARRRQRDPHEAAELVQEVFLHAMRKIGQLREPVCFGAWLHRITARLAINRATRRPPLPTAETEILENNAKRGGTPLDELMLREQRSAVRSAVADLKPIDREVLEAFYLRGQSLAWIANEFQIPIGTVKRRLHVARQRLGSRLGVRHADAAAASEVATTTATATETVTEKVTAKVKAKANVKARTKKVAAAVAEAPVPVKAEKKAPAKVAVPAVLPVAKIEAPAPAKVAVPPQPTFASATLDRPFASATKERAIASATKQPAFASATLDRPFASASMDRAFAPAKTAYAEPVFASACAGAESVLAGQVSLSVEMPAGKDRLLSVASVPAYAGDRTIGTISARMKVEITTDKQTRPAKSLLAVATVATRGSASSLTLGEPVRIAKGKDADRKAVAFTTAIAPAIGSYSTEDVDNDGESHHPVTTNRGPRRNKRRKAERVGQRKKSLALC